MQSLCTAKNGFQFNTFNTFVTANNLIVVTLYIFGRELTEVLDLWKNFVTCRTNVNRTNNNALLVCSRTTKGNDFLEVCVLNDTERIMQRTILRILGYA